MKREELKLFVDRVAFPTCPEERDDAEEEILREYDRLVTMLRSLKVPDWVIFDRDPEPHTTIVAGEPK